MAFSRCSAGRFCRRRMRSGKNHVVVLSHPFWQRVFGGERNVIGRSLQLNGETYTVIGVAPPEFGQGQQGRISGCRWPSPRKSGATNIAARITSTSSGRLKPGVTATQADAEIKLLAAQLAKQYPDSNKGWGAFVMPMLELQRARCAGRALHAARRGRLRAPHRLREHRQSPPRPRDRAASRAFDSRRARGEPFSTR